MKNIFLSVTKRKLEEKGGEERGEGREERQEGKKRKKENEGD